MTGLLQGKVALITGAARGQGESAARIFHAEGASVVLADVLDDLGEAVAKELGDRAIYRHLDVRDEAGWAAVVAAAEDAFGPVTVLHNNAAVLRAGTVVGSTRQDFLDLMDVNVWGCVVGMQQVLPSMRRAGGGSIINVSSTGGLIGQPGAVTYSASKAAVRGLTKAAAIDLAPEVRVNSLHPGWVDTPMVREKNKQTDEEYLASLLPVVPMARAAHPDELARAALFLASDLSSYVTGSELVVDGGRTAGTPVRR
ncbi:glucose 1-dehydrogenase [Actinomadura bangladeshensis]|uniref:Glucose 1-dehydrogenase n=1 Tax=Actinomadura bangladeshensis TaxID=453573 RepID=A0A4R4PET7_9ACTN|nr:glucose 1-dehydrogenase [Actinomadura bangladeshensis]TDC20383.1 glucose 1-dehydrogenase [Actinomadura bangladeshensis]